MELHNIKDLESGIQLVKSMYNEKFITSFDYESKEMERFKGLKLNGSLASNIDFISSLSYIGFLFEIIRDWNPTGTDLPKPILDELFEWEKNGGQCIYLSFLLYALLRNDGISDSNITYCQGMYWHKCRDDNPLGKLLGENQSGLHAWLEVKGAIVDISIGQEEQFFDFKGPAMVLGELPSGLDYYGFRESKSTPKEYARKAARKMGLTYVEWVSTHKREALKRYIDHLEGLK
ncbi:hypothetical protein M2277_004944 [Paenibacillus sp. LBL]|uniref:hypothetical protein n=1 Tax=Paenibacillus sp. LBL TaxID=2940563 RepID=UPI002476F342|nr:hypothetical protein [Paenibacillus sp. LBL]MDH6674252.1 hypothetical protein [Paenibacillus sp. LBL]